MKLRKYFFNRRRWNAILSSSSRFSIVGILLLVTFVQTACSEDDSKSAEPDLNFKPTLSDMLGVWKGEYEGYDIAQSRNVKIRRMLTLNPDSTYSNILGGIFTGTGDYKPIEMEHGRYVYDGNSCVITYYTSVDSVINHQTTTFEVYDRKHCTDGDRESYSDIVRFADPYGDRLWMLTDSTMQSIDRSGASVVYSLSQDPDAR